MGTSSAHRALSIKAGKIGVVVATAAKLLVVTKALYGINILCQGHARPGELCDLRPELPRPGRMKEKS